jgi:signal transduction histidine kinase
MRPALQYADQSDGIGIEPRYHQRLFNLFERLHDAGDFPGYGVGLAIVARAAEG